MEWKDGSTSYIIPIDSVDIELLSVLSVRQDRRHSDAAADSPIPVWSANELTKEYYNFQVYETVEDHAELDVNLNTQPCHICNVDVPTAYIKEHYKSSIHKTLMQIVENAIERSRKHILAETFILDTKYDPDFFCTFCVEVVKLINKNHHEASKNHRASVKYDECIKEFATAFMDRDSFIENFKPNVEEPKCSPNVEKANVNDISNTCLTTQDTVSLYKPPEPHLDKEISSTEQHLVGSSASSVNKSECQLNTTSFGIQNHQIKDSVTNSSETTPKQKDQGPNKPTMTKNYIHWLNINKLTPVSEKRNQYHCGYCNFILFKAALFDHCNNALHKSNVDKITLPKDCSEVKTDASRDTLTTGVTARTRSPEDETAKTELKVNSTIIELTQMDFYHCEVCKKLVPNTETDITVHINSKMHLKKNAKYEKNCKQIARRVESLSKVVNKNNTKPLSKEENDKITAIVTPGTSQERQEKLCKYLTDGITELSHINSDIHMKNFKTLEHDKSRNVVPIEITATVCKEDKDSYDCKINKPSTSTQPDVDQSKCKDIDVKQLKVNNTDTGTNWNCRKL